MATPTQPTDLPSAATRNRRRHRRAIWRFLRSQPFLGGLLLVVSLALIVAHGLPDLKFQVDWVSLGLLGAAALPFLSRLLVSLKAGSVEVAFRDLSQNEQLFVFLDAVAAKQRWTFFAPRAGESPLGPAFALLTKELVDRARSRLVDQLRLWLAADEGQRWFAAEIVGYHHLLELRQAVRHAPESRNQNDDWEPWELNCVWAYSRMDAEPYQTLLSFLSNTQSQANQDWILKALDQMIEARLESPDRFAAGVRAFLAREMTNGRSLEQVKERLTDCPCILKLIQQ